MADNMRAFLEKCYGPYFSKYLSKADDPVLSTEAGYSNVKFGARAFVNFMFSDTTFAVLAKAPYEGDGMRLIYDPGTKSTGIAENAALSDTNKPDVLETTVGFKEENSTIELTTKAITKARVNDYVDLQQMLELQGALHTAGINAHMNVDGNTLASNNTESNDRLTASAAYATAASWDAGDEDFNGVDVSTYTWYDPITDHNSGTDRTWSNGYFYSVVSSIKDNKGIPTKALTKGDTYGQMSASAQTQMRFAPAGEFRYTNTEEGVKVSSGGDMGFPIASIDGVPIFVDPDIQADGIGRVYIIDDNLQYGVPQVHVNIATPTVIQTANNAVLLDAFKEKSVYYTALELRCTSRFRQGSIRDLKASSL